MSTTKTKAAPPKEEPKKSSSFANAARAASGAGFENASDKDFQIPFLAIIQKGSPQLAKQDAAYIKGAETGDILNTATGRVYKVIGEEIEELIVVPCGFQPAFVEWNLRSKGGGFVAVHAVSPETRKADADGNLSEKGRFNLTKQGTHIVETKYHSVIVQDVDDWYPAVIALASTQLKKSRKWMSEMKARKMVGDDGVTFNPPMFSNRYKVGTGPESNNFGDWYGWTFTFVGPTDEELFDRAFAAHKSFMATPQLPAPPSAVAPEGDETDI